MRVNTIFTCAAISPRANIEELQNQVNRQFCGGMDEKEKKKKKKNERLGEEEEEKGLPWRGGDGVGGEKTKLEGEEGGEEHFSVREK